MAETTLTELKIFGDIVSQIFNKVISKFKGIKKENFLLHLKECEFRYNIKIENKNLYQELLKLARKNPLKLS